LSIPYSGSGIYSFVFSGSGVFTLTEGLGTYTSSFSGSSGTASVTSSDSGVIVTQSVVASPIAFSRRLGPQVYSYKV
jgi:hypothetical protein